MAENTAVSDPSSSPPLPRVTIQFCTQCKWMLRAAYFAQELLSTFSTALGEVALQPTTGGVFRVEVVVAAPAPTAPAAAAAGFHSRALLAGPAPTRTRTHVLWDRKADGGFPETKELKRRVRDVVDPARDLGHVDRDYPRPPPSVIATGGMPEGGAPPQAQGQGRTEADPEPGTARPPVQHGVGAHTKKPPIGATDEVRERLEARHRAKEAEAAAAGSTTTAAAGTAAAAEEKRAECEDCA